jgi:hypothetical protein
MEAGCNERILENGTGELVLRDVNLTGMSLSLAGTYDGAIILAGGSLRLIGGQVSGNTVTSTGFVNGFFEVAQGAGEGFDAEGVVIADNTQNLGGGNCGIVCSYGSARFFGSVLTNNRADAADYVCGGVACTSDDVEFVDSLIADTYSMGDGGCGGIACTGGNLVLTRTAVVGTTMIADDDSSVCGGIVCISGSVTLTDSSVTGTVVSDLLDSTCGAIVCASFQGLTLVRSTLAATSYSLSGGGENDCPAMLCGAGAFSAVNSTIADNVTTGGEGLAGSFGAESIEFVYVTFSGNSGSGLAALVPDYDADESVSFSTFGSVLAGSGSGGTCSPDVVTTSGGYNWADDTSCGLTGTGDTEAVGGNPQLAPLADNGGPGPTLLPAVTSPLVDAVPAAACQAELGITTDERGLPRPSSLGPNCDIGAVELQPEPPPVPIIEPTFAG